MLAGGCGCVTPHSLACTEMALTFDLARHAQEWMVAVHLQHTIMKVTTCISREDWP